jgi:tetratricopeptide (TPR) repeat protein
MIWNRSTCIVALALFGAAGGAGWWLTVPSGLPSEVPADAELPVPPLPPRIKEGSADDTCLASDPVSATARAEALAAEGAGEGALHCRALGLIAVGKPDAGAALLEQLAQRSTASPSARAAVLGQAVQARLMVGQAGKAAADASLALNLSPSDADLFIIRAVAEGMQDRFEDAIEDTGQALLLDPGRSDALVLRATMRRKLTQLELALADVSQALGLNPDDPDALLERGILRQRAGDSAGARADWEHAREADPASTTADLAEQDLSLLEAGPRR